MNNNCAICQNGHKGGCWRDKCQYELSNQHKLIDDFYFNEFPNNKELIKETLKQEYDIIVEDKKFRSRGEAIMYVWYIRKYCNSPDLIIHQEESLNKYGCPRALRADFLICNKWNVPLAVIEVNGPQHYTDTSVIERDKYKKEWCRENCIVFMYGDWSGKDNLDFVRWYGGNANFYNHWINDWEATEAFEERLRALNKLGGINKSLEQRKADKPICDELRAQQIKDMMDLGWIF